MPVETAIDDVMRVVRRWARSFGSGDAAAATAVWDTAYSEVVYQAEEFPEPLRSVGEIAYYNERMAELVQVQDPELVEMHADVIGECAWCYMRGRARLTIAGFPPVSGETRQTFVLRRAEGEWRVIHYHESRETRELREPLASAFPPKP